MIIWGGRSSGGYLNSGGRYNLAATSWAPLPLQGLPAPRCHHTAVWTGQEMIVWGGYNGINRLNDGGRYDPTLNSWTPLSLNRAPAALDYHTAVWTGSKMIVWGGFDGSTELNDTWAYSPYPSAILSWAVQSNTVTLWQNPDLATTNWTTVTNSVTVVNSENHVVICPVAGSRFFRLSSP